MFASSWGQSAMDVESCLWLSRGDDLGPKQLRQIHVKVHVNSQGFSNMAYEKPGLKIPGNNMELNKEIS